MEIFVRQPIDIIATFVNRAGALADPPDVAVELRSPAGTVVEYKYDLGEVERDSQGVYRLTTRPATAGTWEYRVEGADPVAGVFEGMFVVRPTVFVDVTPW